MSPGVTQLPRTRGQMRDEPKGSFPYYTTGVCCLAMFGCAFNMTVVFPFIPRLVEDLGMVEDPRKPGYFAGYLTSAQQLGRILTSIAWGWVADRYGRKPVATISVVMTGITALAFGFCKMYWLAVGIRLLNGLCDFMLGTAKMMLTELIEPYHQARAMSYLGACWGIAVIVGPTFGGLLARPADKYPDWIAADSLLGRYPYALPNIVTACLCAIGTLLLQTLPESLPGGAKPMCSQGQQPEIPTESDSNGESESLLHDGLNSDAQSKPAYESSMSNKCQFCLDEKPALSISFYTVAMFVEFFDPMLLSLWASAPADAGGLAYNTSQIGSVLAVTGGSLIFFQILIYPSANRMYGTLGLLRRLVCLQLPFWCAIPLAATSGFPFAANPAIQYGYVAVMFALRKAMAEMSFTNMNLVLNNSVPAGRRGVFNGFSMAVSGFGKMAGPAIGGPLFAWSITNGLSWPFDHSLSFYGCAMITAVLAWITFRMPESIAFPCEEDHEEKSADERVSLARPQTTQA